MENEFERIDQHFNTKIEKSDQEIKYTIGFTNSVNEFKFEVTFSFPTQFDYPIDTLKYNVNIFYGDVEYISFFSFFFSQKQNLSLNTKK